MSSLLGMSGIALIDSDSEQQPCAADLVRPRRNYARHTGGLNVFSQRGAHNGAIATYFVRRTLGWTTEQDWFVTVVNCLDVEDRLWPHIAGVIAGPFAKRALDTHIVRLDKTFDYDLSVRWNRQSGHRTLDYIDRRAANATKDFQLADPKRHLTATHQEAQGIATADNNDWHALSARLIFVAHLAAVFARRNVEAQRLLIVDHHPVGATIDPASVRITRDVITSSANVASAVGMMPLRRRESGDIDVLAGHGVLHDWAVVDVSGRNTLHLGGIIGAESFAQLHLGQIGRKAERHILALAAEKIHQNSAAFD